jgi:hypothetical protein
MLRSIEEILRRSRGVALRRTWIEQPYDEEEITILEEDVIPAIQQITVVFCGPQLDPPGLGRPVA